MPWLMVYHRFHCTVEGPLGITVSRMIQECANGPGLRQLLHSNPGRWRSGCLGKSQQPPDQLQSPTDEDEQCRTFEKTPLTSLWTGKIGPSRRVLGLCHPLGHDRISFMT